MGGGISLALPGNTNTPVSLLHNTVKIKVSPDLCRTRAFFRLYNTGEPTELEVGFPLIAPSDAADFQVFVDSRPVLFAAKTKNYKTPIGQEHTGYWKVWEMKFDRKQTSLVEVRYSNPTAEGWWSQLNTFQFPTYYEWKTTLHDYNLADYGYAAPVKLHEWVNLKEAVYLLISGSYWKGSIERCRIEVDIADIPTESIVKVEPPAKSFSPQQVVWEWKNVEPAANINITFLRVPASQSMPYLEKIVAHNPQDQAARETLDQLKQCFKNKSTIKERQNKFVQPQI